MPKGLPPLTLKEFRKIMEAFGYIELSGSKGSHIAFVSKKDFENKDFHNLVFAESRIGATIPHGGGKDVPTGDIKNAIKKLSVSRKDFYAIVGKQIPGKRKS